MLLEHTHTHTHAAISEAFEVLSDPKKKKLYDQFGEAGLGAGGGDTQDVPFTRATASGARRPGAGASHQTFSFSTNRGGGGGGGGGFQHSDPFSIFESIFGTGDVHKGTGCCAAVCGVFWCGMWYGCSAILGVAR